MRDTAVVVGRRVAFEAELLVELRDVCLCANTYRVAGELGVEYANALADEQAPEATLAILRRNDDAAERGRVGVFVVTVARAEEAGVGDENSGGVDCEQVPGVDVVAVEISVGAGLFDDENTLTQLQERIQGARVELFECTPDQLHVAHVTRIPTLPPFCRRKRLGRCAFGNGLDDGASHAYQSPPNFDVGVPQMVKLPEEILYDIRLVERHIRQGLTTRADYEAHLKNLADAAEHADNLDVEVLANGRAPDENDQNEAS